MCYYSAYDELETSIAHVHVPHPEKGPDNDVIRA